VVDDPDPVGENVGFLEKTVTPSCLARRRTSSQSALRLCGSRPVVGSSRKRMRGE
jgi:hypothetical protein